jgi:hypothetical protein
MIALLSALLGFVSSGFPEFIQLFREQKDRRHEIALLELQMQHASTQQENAQDAAKREYRYQLEAIDIQRDMHETQALNARPDGAQGRKTGIFLVDALSGSVRPLITYLFFGVYAAVKMAQYRLLVTPLSSINAPLNHDQALLALWTQDDMAVFTAIIAFWFGSRLFKKRAYYK